MSVALAREMALELEGASESPHFHRIAFRTPRKTFATLDAEACDLNLMFDPELRDFHCEQEPAVFRPVAGGWGRMGATRGDLVVVDVAALRSTLRLAHRLAAPGGERRR